MKNLLGFLCLLILFSFSSFAQCDFTVTKTFNNCIRANTFASINLTSSDASTWLVSPQTGVLGSVTDDSDDKKFFATFQNPGNFTVTITSKESGCSEDIDFTVHQASEIITNIKTDYYLCNGSTEFDIQLTNIDKFDSYNWIYDESLVNDVPLELTFAESVEKDVLIQATDKNGCSTTNNYSISVKDGLVIEDLTTNRIDVADGCVDAGLDYSIELTHNSNLLNSYVNPPVYPIPTSEDGDLLSEEFTIPVIVSFEDSDCQIETNVVYSHDITHEVLFETAYDEVLCLGDSITLLNTSSHKGDSNNFSWSGISDEDIVSSNSNAIEFVPSADGNYNWTLDYTGTCPSSYSSQREVNIEFIDPILSDDIIQSTCDFNLPVNLSHQTQLEFLPNEYSFSWIIDPSLPSLDNSLSLSSSNSSATLELISSKAQSYDLNLSIENTTTGCSGSKAFKNYFSIGGVVAEINSEPSLFCGLGTINTADLLKSSEVNDFDYNWSFKRNNDEQLSSNSYSSLIEFDQFGAYDVELNIKSSEGCESTVVEEDLLVFNDYNTSIDS
ncbi:hypothetical protein N9V23_03930, partial [Flavobacteriales bacterium]|nr:hypothetical protein [Flavobacteriales bacterium]